MPIDQIGPVYHYPPEVFDLIVDCVVHCFRSKQAVIDFFRGAGATGALLDGWQQKVRENREAVKMAHIARSVLRELNDGGDARLTPRREVIKRLVEIDDFSSCYPENRLKAEGLIARLRSVVNVKDSFTRLNIELDQERANHRMEHERRAGEQRAKRERCESVCRDLKALFVMQDAWKRGKALERVLNELFRVQGIGVREDFVVRGREREGIVEQVDGVVEFDGHTYLVEVKWHAEPLGRGDVATHQVNLFSRAGARGIIVSASGFSAAAEVALTEFLHHRVCIMCELRELLLALEQGRDIGEILRQKVRFAITEKRPFVLVG